MDFNFLESVGALTPQQRHYFYELFAHHLTVAMRGILFFEGLADEDRVERAKWLNEIAHRITFKVFVLHKNEPHWTDEDILEIIRINLEKNPQIAPDVNAALESSFYYVKQNESES